MTKANKARDFALERHGQQRYGERPYGEHLAEVVGVLAEFGQNCGTSLNVSPIG